MLRLIIIVILLSISTKMLTQKDTVGFFESNKIGITLSALINEYQGFQINYAHGLSPKMDLNTELGYLFGVNLENEIKGFRLRVQPRFNLAKYKENKWLYMSPFLQLRHTNTTLELYNRFSPSDLAKFNLIENRIGVGAMMGSIIQVGERFYFNVGFGVGINIIQIQHKNVPFGIEVSDSNVQNNFTSLNRQSLYEEGWSRLQLFTGHLNFSYRL